MPPELTKSFLLLVPQLQHTNDLAAAQTLRAAFSKVEQKNPGFSQEFVNGILQQRSPGVDLTESLLKLAAYDSEGIVAINT